MDQFTFAERATDWRGNNNVAESMFRQLELEPQSVPDWIVVSAGTGGTSATIAIIQFLEQQLNNKVGGSTGINVFAALQILSKIKIPEQPMTILSMNDSEGLHVPGGDGAEKINSAGSVRCRLRRR